MAPPRKGSVLAAVFALALALQRTEAFTPASTLAGKARPSVGRMGSFVPSFNNVASTPNVRTRGADLQMSAAPVVSAGVGALAGAISGGVFAGGLHAIAGEGGIKVEGKSRHIIWRNS
mmetsp:Transcript_38878/g.116903  ORF Transcript_38878/g.116903 Transcript_38878/m.116903 type:complete len:118 (+) Transcript_38878:133-486(+)